MKCDGLSHDRNGTGCVTRYVSVEKGLIHTSENVFDIVYHERGAAGSL